MHMAKNEDFFTIPEKLPFPDLPYRSITGEISTLHRLLRLPAERGLYRPRRRTSSQWKPEDKANLVKILDDEHIAPSTKEHIRKILAIHSEEIEEYRNKMEVGGLPALEERWDGQNMKEYPTQALKQYGPLALNPETGDVRYGQNLGFLSNLQTITLTALLGSEYNTNIPIGVLQERAHAKVTYSTLYTLQTLLRYLSGKELIVNVQKGVYKFSPYGVHTSPQ